MATTKITGFHCPHILSLSWLQEVTCLKTIAVPRRHLQTLQLLNQDTVPAHVAHWREKRCKNKNKNQLTLKTIFK